jgi:HSP20 family protein
MVGKKSLAKRSLEPFRPKVDVVTKGNTLITRVDWPGMTKDDVRVDVEDGQLVLSGDRKKELKEDKDNVNREARNFDSFRGVVHLPKDVKPNDVKVTFANSVLEVMVRFPFMVRATSDGCKIADQDAATTKAA